MEKAAAELAGLLEKIPQNARSIGADYELKTFDVMEKAPPFESGATLGIDSRTGQLLQTAGDFTKDCRWRRFPQVMFNLDRQVIDCRHAQCGEKILN